MAIMIWRAGQRQNARLALMEESTHHFPGLMCLAPLFQLQLQPKPIKDLSFSKKSNLLKPHNLQIFDVLAVGFFLDMVAVENSSISCVLFVHFFYICDVGIIDFPD